MATRNAEAPTRRRSAPRPKNGQSRAAGHVTIGEVMSREVWSCAQGASLNDAVRLMWEHDIGAVPVVDEHNKVVGILTDRDIAIAAFFQGRPLSEIPVERAMSADVRTAKPHDLASQAADAMARHQVRRLPVVADDGAVVGILSERSGDRPPGVG